MLIEDIKKIKSSKKELKSFGLTIGVTLLVAAGIIFWSGGEAALYFATPAIVFLVLAQFCPLVLKPVQRLWMMLALVLGWFTTRVVLSVLFYLVLTPTGLAARLLGKKFLHLGIDKSRESYWNYRDTQTADKNNYEKQF